MIFLLNPLHTRPPEPGRYPKNPQQQLSSDYSLSRAPFFAFFAASVGTLSISGNHGNPVAARAFSFALLALLEAAIERSHFLMPFFQQGMDIGPFPFNGRLKRILFERYFPLGLREIPPFRFVIDDMGYPLRSGSYYL